MLLKLAKYKVVFVVIFTLMLGLMMSPALAALDDACTSNAGCDLTNGERCDLAQEICVGTFGVPEIQGSDLKLGKDTDFISTITQIINVALSLLGIVAVVIILAGGFKWMTAGGNEEKTTEARKLIFAGIIGLAIIMSAWAIAQFVINNLGEATGAYDVPPTT